MNLKRSKNFVNGWLPARRK